MNEPPGPIPGYVRSDVIHLQAEWVFEQDSETPKVGVVTITTADGSVLVGLNRIAAEHLIEQLELFLAEFPEGRPAN